MTLLASKMGSEALSSVHELHMPWGMVESPRSAPGWYVGVTGNGRWLVWEDDMAARRPRAVVLPRIPRTDPATEWQVSCALIYDYLEKTRPPKRGCADSAVGDLHDMVVTQLCAAQKVGYHEADLRWWQERLERGDAMPWTVTDPEVPRVVASIPDALDDAALTTFSLVGTSGAGSKRPTAPWGDLLPGARHERGASAYGIALAPSDLVLIDLDVKGEARGLEEWLAWTEALGCRCGPRGGFSAGSTPLVVHTASGGWHLLYRQNPRHRLRSCDGVLPGVDIKGGWIEDERRVGQGMAVGAGSRVLLGDDPMEVGAYIVTHEPGSVGVLPDELAVPLKELIGARKPRRSARRMMTPVEKVEPAALPRWAWLRLQRLETAIRECPPGTRHDTINREVFAATVAGVPPELVAAVAHAAIKEAGIVDHDHEVEIAIGDALVARDDAQERGDHDE